MNPYIYMCIKILAKTGKAKQKSTGGIYNALLYG